MIAVRGREASGSRTVRGYDNFGNVVEHEQPSLDMLRLPTLRTLSARRRSLNVIYSGLSISYEFTLRGLSSRRSLG